MTQSRETATPQAQDDLDGLLNAALPFAQRVLDDHGEFLPYGLALDEYGEQRMVAGDPGRGEQPAILDVLATLVEGLRLQHTSLRAVAFVSDDRLSDTDAVRVELEHSDGHAMAVYLPYKTKRGRRVVEFGSLSAGPSSPRVWST